VSAQIEISNAIRAVWIIGARIKWKDDDGRCPGLKSITLLGDLLSDKGRQLLRYLTPYPPGT